MTSYVEIKIHGRGGSTLYRGTLIDDPAAIQTIHRSGEALGADPYLHHEFKVAVIDVTQGERPFTRGDSANPATSSHPSVD